MLGSKNKAMKEAEEVCWQQGGAEWALWSRSKGCLQGERTPHGAARDGTPGAAGGRQNRHVPVGPYPCGGYVQAVGM